MKYNEVKVIIFIVFTRFSNKCVRLMQDSPSFAVEYQSYLVLKDVINIFPRFVKMEGIIFKVLKAEHRS